MSVGSVQPRPRILRPAGRLPCTKPIGGHGRESGRRRKPVTVVAVRPIEVANQSRRVVPQRIDQRVQLTASILSSTTRGQALPALLRRAAAWIAVGRRSAYASSMHFSIDV